MFVYRKFKKVDELEKLLKEIDDEATEMGAVVDSFSIVQRTHDNSGNIFDNGSGAIIALAKPKNDGYQ